MQWLLIVLICAYRKFFPPQFKRHCLFKESCPKYALRITQESGFIAGCHAIKQRFRQCRPLYTILYDEKTDDWQIEFSDGTHASCSIIADFVMEPYKKILKTVNNDQ